jgi:hypothetical protein
MINKLYVLVRGDLQPGVQIAQSCHAVADFMLNHDVWKNETIVCLKVKDEAELMKWEHLFYMNQFKYNSFREPDMDNQLTAIAAHDVSLPKILKKLNLV